LILLNGVYNGANADLGGDPCVVNEAKKALAASSALKGRAGLAKDFGNAALWHASDEFGYTSAHALATDAGPRIGSNDPTPLC
jgi:hypothetical protein